MANAVYVYRVKATTGNAVYVQSVTAAAVAPVGNAVIVYGAKAVSVPAAGNAVFVHGVAATSIPAVGNAVLVHSLRTAVSGQAPTANAGPDQTAVEPWSTVTLTGASSSGTGLSYAWSQVGGAPVTLTGSGATRTFTAPPAMDPSSLLFALAVTDGAGLVSIADTVVVSVLPVTEFARAGGTWAPRRLRKRSGGAWV